MHTLADLIAAARPLPEAGAGPRGWPAGWPPKGTVPVPSAKKLVLPSDPAGLSSVDGPGGGVPELGEEDARAARALLLSKPGLVLPLHPPTEEQLVGVGVDPGSLRRESPRAVGAAVAVTRPDGSPVYGATRVLALEHGLRHGSTLLLAHDDRWTEDLFALEEMLLDLLLDAPETVPPRPEPSGRAWRTVVAVLGGGDDAGRLPPGWRRHLALAAGLHGVTLDVRTNPEGARRQVLADLRQRPPHGLLVWAEWVAAPEAFLAAYRSARPDGYAELLGAARERLTFREHLGELLLHLEAVAPLRHDAEPPLGTAPQVDWALAEREILALAGPHFVLTERARRMVRRATYPYPARMLHHARRLAELAAEYAACDGRLGARLCEVAIAKYGIEVALNDTGLSPPSILIDGRTLRAEPHVKVDDHKAKDRCGRIYFAIDTVGRRLVVDHIGLHDYG